MVSIKIAKREKKKKRSSSKTEPHQSAKFQHHSKSNGKGCVEGHQDQCDTEGSPSINQPSKSLDNDFNNNIMSIITIITN